VSAGCGSSTFGVWADAETARIEPFEAIEFQVGDLWAPAAVEP
jgi:hypothetical protein